MTLGAKCKFTEPMAGYDEYIRPYVEAGIRMYMGLGKSGDSIQNLIAQWQDLADFDYVAINADAAECKIIVIYYYLIS